MYGRNELVLLCTIPRDSIDFQRTLACVFVIGHHTVSVVVAVPCLFRCLLYLNDDILIVDAIDLDFLT